jgi:hypothetical protein
VKSQVLQESWVSQPFRSGSSRLYAVVLVAALALALMPAGASAASPVLEFVVPGHSVPIPFTTESGPVSAEMAGFTSLVHCAASHGEGEITGPRTAVAEYQFTGCITEKGSNTKCKSLGAKEEEIATAKIDAELVFIDQAKHEVGVLLDPNGGTYIAFDCGGEAAEGRGPFLAPVSPVNTEAAAFTAILSQSGSAQTPDEFETLTGEKVPAIPMGKHGAEPLVTTGVEATFTIHPSWPGEIEAITGEEVQAEEEAAAAKKKQEEEATAIAAAKKHQEEEAIATAAKKHEEEVAAAAKKRQEEEAAAAKKKQEEADRPTSKPTRAQLLARALKACEKQPKKRRARCISSAHKKYGARAKKKGRHKA